MTTRTGISVPFNPVYSPYGAFELKACYQRNLAVSWLVVTCMIGSILAGFWLAAVFRSDAPVAFDPGPIVTGGVFESGPPPTVIKTEVRVSTDPPQAVMPTVGIPEPVPDNSAIGDDMVLATRDELAEYVAADGLFSDGDPGLFVIADVEDDPIPEPEDFQSLEIQPEFILQMRPQYPRLAKEARLEGVVTVQVLVDKEGRVRDVRIARSSESPILDEAAVKAARRCRFKPGIQNGMAVFCWVAFRYEFRLDGCD
jgi:protein TonB